ncbi:hypothetical protein Ndes2526A_g04614 [Nannochloris sp. 'desiccata']
MLDDKRRMLFFFDRGLLAMGNILFLAGVTMTIGFQSTIKFFMRPKNYKGTGFFLGGLVLVIWGWTLIGFILEAYGFWRLFSAFFPTALSFLRRMPFLKQILDTPTFKSLLNKIAPAGSSFGGGLPV